MVDAVKVALLGVGLFVIAGCSGGADAGVSGGETPTSDLASTAPTEPATSPSITTPPEPPPTDPADGRDDSCLVTVAAGDFLARVADRVEGVSVEALQEENRLADGHIIHPGDELDVCVGNDVDDVTGASRLPPPPAAVRSQQTRLNELFAPYRIADLAVDGDSGPMTRQLLCAARMGLGLPISATNMAPDSAEEDALFAAAKLSIPDGAAVWDDKWILIDKTCQVMVTGEANEIVDIYPTSTGEAGFETRDSQAASAFRFDPALDTDGWHDSTNFPVEIDNPLNGNMYKPLYFNAGQAIHGANYVPPEPRSKGCARMFPWHQDLLIGWLGLDDVEQPTWNESQIGVTVTVQGDYRAAD